MRAAPLYVQLAFLVEQKKQIERALLREAKKHSASRRHGADGGAHETVCGTLIGVSADATISIILFSDLVDSTARMQQLGDEQARSLFAATYDEMTQVVEAHAGEPLQWVGDGLVAAFRSCGDAVRCAIALQQGARWRLEGFRLRIGMSVGEVLRQQAGAGYFGTPVVIAARLCARAQAGQILASALVAGLLTGRKAYRFRDVGALELKGIATPVATVEIDYGQGGALRLAAGTPFVGRVEELSRLNRALERATAGQGAVVFVTGDAGIGKTRLLDAFARRASASGARVLRGRCFEGETQRPFGPFAAALDAYVGSADASELAADAGAYGAALFTLAPRLRAKLPQLEELPALSPESERERLFYAVVQLLLATGKRAPLVLWIDDLHWADAATVALFRHIGRFARDGRLLLLGTYRDVEIGREHPLAPALAALRREAEYERIALTGLDTAQVTDLLQALAQHEVPATFAERLRATAAGNPFFLREYLMHLVEEGVLRSEAASWSAAVSLDTLEIPEGVRQVLGRRLERLSPDSARLLTVCSAFHGDFSFEPARRVAGLDLGPALDALDEALHLQLVATAGGGDRYEFGHDLIRQAVYTAMSSARRLRLHRRIAEELERASCDASPASAGEIAWQYHRSRELPGAERGVVHAVAAADEAERAGSSEEMAEFLRLGLEMLPDGEPRRPRLLARRALALARGMRGEEAVRLATDAGERLAASEGPDAAADCLAKIVEAMVKHARPLAWRLAEQGLRYLGARRDLTWVHLAREAAFGREAADPDNPGISLDSPVQHEIAEVALRAGASALDDHFMIFALASRDEALRYGSTMSLAFQAGDMRGMLPRFARRIERALARGELGSAVIDLAYAARMHCALGEIADARECIDRATRLAGRLAEGTYAYINLLGSRADLAFATGEALEPLLSLGELVLSRAAPDQAYARGATWAYLAYGFAWIGRTVRAVEALSHVIPAVDRGAGWAPNYPGMVHTAIGALWLLDRADFAGIVERNLRAKVLAPDFRYPHADARLSLARLCALQGRHDEAVAWFARSREVLGEQGARPLFAIADYDEGLTYVRRDAPGDRRRALPLFDRALSAFRSIGMPGWEQRALGGLARAGAECGASMAPSPGAAHGRPDHGS